LRGREARPGFRPGFRQFSMRGRRANRTPAGLSPRPPVSNRVPYQSRPAFQCSPGGIRTSRPCGHGLLRPARLPIPPPGLEWPTRFELALRPWQGRVLPLTLRPHGASGEIRTHDLRLTEAALCPLELQRRRSGSRTRTCVRRFQGPAGMPATHPGMEPSPGADPGLLPYKGRVTAVCDGVSWGIKIRT
jgi:hypothetical protein